MPTSIQQIVSDPEFGKLPPEDQSAVVAHFDSDFNQVPEGEKATVIQHLQRQAVSRPDLAAPPGVRRPEINMQPWGGNPSPTAGLPGSSPYPYSAGPGYTAAVGLPLAAAGGYAALAAGPVGYAAGYGYEGAKAALNTPVGRYVARRALDAAGVGGGFALYDLLKGRK